MNPRSLESLTLLPFKYVSVIYLSYSTFLSHYTHCAGTISLLKCIAISSRVRDKNMIKMVRIDKNRAKVAKFLP